MVTEGFKGMFSLKRFISLSSQSFN